MVQELEGSGCLMKPFFLFDPGIYSKVRVCLRGKPLLPMQARFRIILFVHMQGGECAGDKTR